MFITFWTLVFKLEIHTFLLDFILNVFELPVNLFVYWCFYLYDH